MGTESTRVFIRQLVFHSYTGSSHCTIQFLFIDVHVIVIANPLRIIASLGPKNDLNRGTEEDGGATVSAWLAYATVVVFPARPDMSYKLAHR